MPNILDASGLQTATRAELVADFTAQMQAIYGADINLDSDTPDGQLMGILVQMVLDLEDLLVQIYNSFDPDNAIGVVLDQRVAINGIQRQAGTYTITPITVVTSQSVNLYGLDQTAQAVFTVADNAGNQWQLQATQLGLASGTHSLNFQAAVPGAELTIPNTINVPVTIVLGVTSVNNPTTYTTLGINEESDPQLRVRRQQSVSLASQGYLAGLRAALLNLSGVTAVNIYENTTDSTNGDGVPGHSIWVVVSSSGAAAADIAQAIYDKRNAGCGMYGATTYVLTQVDGSTFTISWDYVVAQNLFVKFTVNPLDGVTAVNIAAIKTYLVANFVPGVYQEVNFNHLATLVQEADPNCLVTNAGFMDGTSQNLVLSAPPASGTFTFAYNGVTSAAINWNDNITTIQTRVRAMAGLSAAVVTGSLASQSIIITLTSNVQALVTVTNNTLQSSVPLAITFTYNYTFNNTLTPLLKTNQFVVSAANIIILALQISPSSATVVHGTSQTFVGLGGYGTYTYSLSVNNSGGSINSSTGIYTAGSTPNVSDTVKVTDAFGDTATASVSVT